MTDVLIALNNTFSRAAVFSPEGDLNPLCKIEISVVFVNLDPGRLYTEHLKYIDEWKITEIYILARIHMFALQDSPEN